MTTLRSTPTLYFFNSTGTEYEHSTMWGGVVGAAPLCKPSPPNPPDQRYRRVCPCQVKFLQLGVHVYQCWRRVYLTDADIRFLFFCLVACTTTTTTNTTVVNNILVVEEVSTSGCSLAWVPPVTNGSNLWGYQL